MKRPYHRLIKLNSSLYSPRAEERLDAARLESTSKRTRRALAERTAGWPPFSPGAANAWLLMVTTKPPNWRDPLLSWPEGPPTLGEPHEGFFYPDPVGFWSEVRRWAVEVFRRQRPTWGQPEALSLTALLHMADDPDRLRLAMDALEPRTVLFLDEVSWARAALTVIRREPHSIEDPHRQGQVYEGFWGKLASSGQNGHAPDAKESHWGHKSGPKDGPTEGPRDGIVIGKSPQHPAMHNLYDGPDMLDFLRSAPVPDGV